MPFINLDDLPPLKNSKNRLMGVDWGEKRTGISLSDVTWLVASPFSSLEVISQKKLISSILNLFEGNNIAAIVIGYPLNMNGSEGFKAEVIKKFSKKLLNKKDIPLILWDERLSTEGAKRIFLEGDFSRKNQKKNIDKVAASFILQGVLDYLSFRSLG